MMENSDNFRFGRKFSFFFSNHTKEEPVRRKTECLINQKNRLVKEAVEAYNKWRNKLDPDDPLRYLMPDDQKIVYPDALLKRFAEITGDQRFLEVMDDFPDKENVTMNDVITALAKRPFQKPDRKK
jgi:hypothetical protein